MDKTSAGSGNAPSLAQQQAELSALLMGAANTRSTPGSPNLFSGALGFHSVRTSPALRPTELGDFRHSFTNLNALAQQYGSPAFLDPGSAAPSAATSPVTMMNRRNLLSGMANLNVAQLPPAAIDNFDPGVVDTSGMFTPTAFAHPVPSDAPGRPGVGGHAGIAARQSTGGASAEHMRRVEDTLAKGLRLDLEGIPSENAKSRVETQIKITLRLTTHNGERATCWTHLALPELLVSRDKYRHRLQGKSQDSTLPQSPQHMVRLEAAIRCSSDPTREVETCRGCIHREYKRSLRRKDNKARSSVPSATTTPGPSRPGSPLGDSLGVRALTGSMDADWDESRMALERKRVVIFNCSDLLDFSKGEVVLPTRITCYCRHHMEKVGFCLYLSLRDSSGNVIASHVSSPIMITDDHKSTKFKTDRSKNRAKAEYDRHHLDVSAAYATHALSGMASPTGPYALGRQAMSARNSPTLRPHGYQSSFLDTYSQFASLAGTPSLGNTPLGSPLMSAGHIGGFESPFHLPQQAACLGGGGGGYPYSTHSGPPMFARDATQSILPVYGATHSAAALGLHAAAAAAAAVQGPGLLDATGLVTHLGGLSTAAAAVAPTTAATGPVQIGQVIPTQGPIVGGVRVMITGRGFHPNMDVYFGDVRAGHVCVEPSSITCILPPTRMTEVVAIHIRDRTTMYDVGDDGAGQRMFTYVEDTDQALVDLGVQVVGLGPLDGGGGDFGGLLHPDSEAVLQTLYSASAQRDLETIEVSLVELLGLQVGQGRIDVSRLQLRHESTGRTLVHFAALLGMCNLLTTLIQYGCGLDEQDNNDMTALHFSCMFGRGAVVELLLSAGASHMLRTCTGQSAADMVRASGRLDLLSLIEERVGYMSFIKDDQVGEWSVADGAHPHAGGAYPHASGIPH
ncbi:SPT3 Dosage dependent suppressor of Ty-induced promoter mutations-like protein [Coemansia biformis]|uniref:SPT3 Dosage dependent suppressor of Ty-induced promoter mutations-like protein n=1 Tax=Coemansia biformis TaxID=1286918 RepID=A0A9W8CY95_9FUNG|nr:SPT3 Dosage dependent suppressor of Ty-induced promoter mutations-like protein [Coemansia biformis]